MQTATPAFRQHASGLYVPEAQSRERVQASKDDFKVIDRATKLLAALGIDLFLGCPQCKAEPIQRVRRPDGGLTLRCQHRDIEFHAR